MATENKPEHSEDANSGLTDVSQMRLTFTLHEYDAATSTVMAAISSQQRVMALGLAGTAVAFTGLLSSWSNEALRTGILALTSLFLIIIWFVWYGEVLRLARTAWFIWELEQVVNAQLQEGNVAKPDARIGGATALRWEDWVRGGNRWGKNVQSRHAYYFATVAMLGTASIFSIFSVIFSVSASNIDGALRVLFSPWQHYSYQC